MGNLIGQTLGQYRITEQIGQGGMATVYKAYQPSLDRYVAVKVLPPYFAHEPGFAMRFTREAKAIAKLNHPNILPIYDFGQEGDLSYIVMKYVKAGTLKDIMGQPLALDVTGDIIRQIAGALDHAHEHGILHRDVKPSNVLLDEDRWVLLTDFGLAKMVEGSAVLTASGVGVGTPAYMSPEQGQGEKVDSRADVYSLGVVLYEMLTGRVPFQAETPMAVVIKHITEPLPLPRSVNPELPESIERVILKAMAKTPDDRFASTKEMADALISATSSIALPAPVTIEIPAEEPISAPPPPPEEAEPVPAPVPAAKAPPVTRKPFPWKIVGAVAAIIVLALAAIFVLSNLGGEEEEKPTVAAAATATKVKPKPTATLPAPTQKPPRPGEEWWNVQFEQVYLKAGFEQPGELKIELPDGWRVEKEDDGSGNHVLIAKGHNGLMFPGSDGWTDYVVEMRIKMAEGEGGNLANILIRCPDAAKACVLLSFSRDYWELIEIGRDVLDSHEVSKEGVWHQLRVIVVENHLAAFWDGDLMFDADIERLDGPAGLIVSEGAKILVDDVQVRYAGEKADKTVTLWHFYDPDRPGAPLLERLLEDVQMADPGLTVRAEYIPFAEIHDRYRQEVAAGGGPDLVLIANDQLGEMAREGLVLNLDPYLDGKLDGISDMGLEGMRIEGKLYGVPKSAKVMALFYNRSWLDAPPATTDELLQIVKEGAPLTLWAGAYPLFGWSGAFGGQLMDADGRCIADQGGWVEALEYLLALQEAGATFEWEHSVAAEPFRAGETPLFIDGLWSLESYRESHGENLGVAPLPAGPGGPANPLNRIDGFYVNPNSESVQAAVDVALFLTSRDSAQLWADKAWDVPVRIDVNIPNPLLETFVEVSATGFQQPHSPALAHYWGPFDDMFRRVLEGEVSPIEGVIEACAAMNEASQSAGPYRCEDALGCIEIPPGEPIHIAYLLDKSGTAAAIGRDSLRGLEIAIEYKGEILGHPIQVTGEDSACSAGGGEAAANMIIEDPSVAAIVGTSCSTAAGSAAPIISEAGLVMVSPSSTSPFLTDPRTHEPGYLRVAPNDKAQGLAAARFARSDVLHVQTAATLHDGTIYSTVLQRIFSEAFEKRGGEIVAQQEIAPGDDDHILGALELLGEIKPDLIYYPLFVDTGVPVTQLARETAGLEETILLGSDAMFNPELLAAGPAAEGVYLSAPKLFVERYAERYGEPPSSPFHVYAFDATMMILEAIEQVAVQDGEMLFIGRQALRDALYATHDFPGLTGTLTCS
ncbi:MAG: hypothetical protein B6I34_09045, partial [Anaerolineaceae bacterium 4572_32.1]